MASIERDSYLDNAKFFLILLVVLGHCIEPWFMQSHLIQSLYLLIYSFHIPAFIVIAGYHTRKTSTASFNPRTMELLALYVVFDILYAGFYYYLFNEIPGRPVLFAPHWIMWFLLSLVLWQITLPWVLKIRHNLMWMLVIGIMIGYLPASGNVLAVSKTLVFYPFFLVGYYLQSYGFKIPHQAQFTYLSVSIFVALGAMLYYYVDPIMMKQLFHGNYSYADLGISGLSAGFCRIIAYLMSGICCLCFFCMISAKKVIFTSAGKYSLHIYLAHGFPVIVLRYTHLLATS